MLKKYSSVFLFFSFSFLVLLLIVVSFLGYTKKVENQSSKSKPTEVISQTTVQETSSQITDEYTVDKSDFLQKETFNDSEKVTLSDREIKGLVQMREEEKLAYDVYITLYGIWNKQVFKNISESEKTHTEAVLGLLEKYNIEDPVKKDGVVNGIGVFTSKGLQELYDDLIAKGSRSLLDAYTVGITIEDLDIADIQVLSTETMNHDILGVYINLERGSRNHMRAFYKNIKKEGGEYKSQYISDIYFDSIISGEQEKGNGNK